MAYSSRGSCPEASRLLNRITPLGTLMSRADMDVKKNCQLFYRSILPRSPLYHIQKSGRRNSDVSRGGMASLMHLSILFGGPFCPHSRLYDIPTSGREELPLEHARSL